MRISDWSSDVCSSDLLAALRNQRVVSTQLVLDLLLATFLDVEHLVDLRPHGVVVLEVEGAHRADVLAPELLLGHQVAPEIAALGSVGRHGQDVFAGDLTFHLQASAHVVARSEEHTSELQSLMRISYAVFCLKKKKT